MRYVIAMMCGIVGAALAAWFVANALAGWFSRQFTYASPDGQSDVEQMSFLAVLVTGLLIGWLIGWMIGAPFDKRRRV
ncbi:MAG: hypothetical protein AAFW82_06015 [Pseudomonadota bacterium]